MLDSINRNPSPVAFFIDGALVREVVRLTHEAASVPANKTTPVGLGTSFSLFCQMRHDTRVKENVVLWDGSNGWRVGAIDVLKHGGEVYGRRAVVQLVNPSSSCAISSFKIGSAIGIINQVTGAIVVVVPSGTDVTDLTPVVAHNGKMISKTGPQDFSAAVSYTVTAENLIQKTYLVTVEVAL